MFGKSTEQWLRKYIKLENGIPDACTFRNVIRAIDMQQLHTVFVEWMKNVVINGKKALLCSRSRKAHFYPSYNIVTV